MHLYRPDLTAEPVQLREPSTLGKEIADVNEAEEQVAGTELKELAVGMNAQILGVRGAASDQDPEFQIQSSSTNHRPEWHFCD